MTRFPNIDLGRAVVHPEGPLPGKTFPPEWWARADEARRAEGRCPACWNGLPHPGEGSRHQRLTCRSMAAMLRAMTYTEDGVLHLPMTVDVFVTALGDDMGGPE